MKPKLLLIAVVLVVEFATAGLLVSHWNSSHDNIATMEVVTPSPITTLSPRYITCSEYSIILEKRKTPAYNYARVSGSNSSIILSDMLYVNASVGDYAKIQYAVTCGDIPGLMHKYYVDEIVEVVHAHPVTEAQSGYRDACEVIS